MKRNAARLGLDLSHFNSERRVRGLTVARELQRRSFAEIFCEGSTVSRPALRSQARLLILPYRCALCSNSGEWQGRPLTLQLDHTNGRYDDNRIENLRWLCPNCHSQTPTFAGRGKARRVREVPAFYAVRARSRRPAPRRSSPV